jgi:hypothetical protein
LIASEASIRNRDELAVAECGLPYLRNLDDADALHRNFDGPNYCRIHLRISNEAKAIRDGSRQREKTQETIE